MQKIFVIALFLMSKMIFAQDLKFMTNEGHQSDITFLQPTKDGKLLITGSEFEIFRWDVRNARVLNKVYSDGKFEAITLSDEGKYIIAVERQIDKTLYINFWSTKDWKLVQKINADSLCHKNFYATIKGIVFSEKYNLLAWCTDAHIFRYFLLNKKVLIDSSLNNYSNFFQELVLGENALFFNDRDIYQKGHSTLYKCGLNETDKIIQVHATGEVIKIWEEPSSKNLYLLKHDSLEIFNTVSKQTTTFNIPFEPFSPTARSSLWKNSSNGVITIAITGRLIEFDPTKKAFKQIIAFTTDLGESVNNPSNAGQIFTARNEKVYLMQLRDLDILTAYSSIKVDAPWALFLTKANRLICESGYTNTIYNGIDLNNLSFKQFKTKEAHTGYGCIIPDENKMIRVIVNYDSLKPQFFIACIDLATDSIEKILLNNIIPADSLYYPEVYISGNNENFIIKNPQSNTLFFIDRKTKKLIDVQKIPIINYGWNSSVKRSFLFTKKKDEVVISDGSIILYNTKERKVISLIHNDKSCCNQYTNITFNHDSTNVIFQDDDELLSYDLNTGIKVSIGFYRWISIVKPITFSGNKYWLLGYNNGYIELRNGDLKSILYKNKIHNSSIREILYDSQNKRVITSGSDHKFCFLELPSLQIEVSGSILFEQGKYSNANIVLINKLNEYYLSSQLTNAIHLISNNNNFDYNSLDPYLNRPDVIARQLNASKGFIDQMDNAYQVRKDRLGIKEIPELNTLPHCSIVNKFGIPYVTDTNSIKLEIQYQPFGKPIKSIQVHVNNVPLFGSNGLLTKNSNKITLTVILTKGTNYIQVYAQDVDGKQSLSESVEVEYKPKEYEKGKLWFIGLGMSGYADSTMNLKYAAKDVLDVANKFKEFTRKKEVVIISLIDSLVFNSKIKTIGQLLKYSEPEDEVIIYYAGHGIRTSKGFMFCLYNTDFKNPNETALPITDLLDIFDSVKARKRLVFIDACQSGDYLQNGSFQKRVSSDKTIELNKRGIIVSGVESKTNDGDLLEFYNTYFTNLSSDEGIQIIAASSGNSYAMEEDSLQNGLFTYCFLKGLFNKEAYPAHPYSPKARWFPTLTELRNYLHTSVKNLSRGKQVPSVVSIDLKNDWDFHELLLDW